MTVLKKIVAVDNFDRDYMGDELIAENVPEHYAQFITDALNNKFSGSTSVHYFMVKPSTYQLREREA